MELSLKCGLEYLALTSAATRATSASAYLVVPRIFFFCGDAAGSSRVSASSIASRGQRLFLRPAAAHAGTFILTRPALPFSLAARGSGTSSGWYPPPAAPWSVGDVGAAAAGEVTTSSAGCGWSGAAGFLARRLTVSGASGSLGLVMAGAACAAPARASDGPACPPNTPECTLRGGWARGRGGVKGGRRGHSVTN